MNKIINRIGEIGAIKLRIVNKYRLEGEYSKNIRECPFYSEFVGIIETLKIMDIDYDIEWSPENVYLATAFIVNNKRFEV